MTILQTICSNKSLTKILTVTSDNELINKSLENYYLCCVSIGTAVMRKYFLNNQLNHKCI